MQLQSCNNCKIHRIQKNDKKKTVDKKKVFFFFKCTFGPVSVLLWHRGLSKRRTRSCRFWTQFWTPFTPEALATSTRTWVQFGEARPHTYRYRESVNGVFWSDFVVQRVFRLNLMVELVRSKSQSLNSYQRTDLFIFYFYMTVSGECSVCCYQMKIMMWSQIGVLSHIITRLL